MIRRIAAHFVFPASSPPIAKGTVETDHSGLIISIFDPAGDLRETAGTEFHNGILCPAFPELFDKCPPGSIPECFPFLKTFEAFMPQYGYGARAVLDWMKAIQQADPEISLEYLIGLFCLKTATHLQHQDETGSLEPGKRPGLLLIDRMDYRNLHLSSGSRVTRLI